MQLNNWSKQKNWRKKEWIINKLWKSYLNFKWLYYYIQTIFYVIANFYAIYFFQIKFIDTNQRCTKKIKIFIQLLLIKSINKNYIQN